MLHLDPDADAVAPETALPASPRSTQPFDGLMLARDPRIPDALEALRFELAWRETPVSVRWEVDGRPVAETADTQYDWSLQGGAHQLRAVVRSEEHTSELQSLMRISYAVFCLQKKNTTSTYKNKIHNQ